MRKFYILFFVAIFLASCAQNPNGELHTSLTNRIISSTKPSDFRRQPLYNQKYIERAKKNVDFGDYHLSDLDELEPDETEDPARDNLAAYQQMLELDRMRRLLDKRKRASQTIQQALKEGDLVAKSYAKNNTNINSQESQETQDKDNDRQIALKKQIEEMKLMLMDMQEKLSTQNQGNRCIVDFNGVPASSGSEEYIKADKSSNQGMCKIMPGSNKNISAGKICYPK